MSALNQDLPILDELEREFAALVEAELERPDPQPAPAARKRLPQRVPRRRRGGARRIAGRASIVLVLLCLVGGVALAARFGAGGDERAAHTAPTLLGHNDSQGWALSAYRDRGRLCLLFSAGGELTSQCGSELAAGHLRATSLVSGDRRFVVGLTGPGVRTVTVKLGGHMAAGPARRPGDPAGARSAGVPAGSRWFAISLPSRSGVRGPATVLPRNAQGRAAAPAYVDCSLGAASPLCERAIRARAGSAAP